MTTDQADPATAEALARVDAFLETHPGLTLEGVEQPRQGNTNRVFFARRGGQVVVLKVFCEPERKARECFGLRHWHATGLVSNLLWDADERMCMTSHLPGMSLGGSKLDEPAADWLAACRQAGQAARLLTQTPLSAPDRITFESRFYRDVPTLEAYLRRILDLGRGINARDADFAGSFWRRSLDFIEAILPQILTQGTVLYHQDVGNLHVLGGRFIGFFDLEMCRVGCQAMQLGSAMVMAEGGNADWDAFREGWESVGDPLTRDDRAATLAARHLLGWREISRYLSYDGTPGTGFDWASPADPAWYHQRFEECARLLEMKPAI